MPRPRRNLAQDHFNMDLDIPAQAKLAAYLRLLAVDGRKTDWIIETLVAAMPDRAIAVNKPEPVTDVASATERPWFGDVPDEPPGDPALTAFYEPKVSASRDNRFAQVDIP